MARTVLLLGDGMYYSAAFAGGSSAARKRIKADRDILLDALDILRRAAR